jgi:hypothetical protein
MPLFILGLVVAGSAALYVYAYTNKEKFSTAYKPTEDSPKVIYLPNSKR